MKPLAIDLFCGLGGWAEGFLAEGYDVVGFDIERHQYGEHKYPAQLVLQDVLTLHGSQFKGKATVIVASPPCQKYSYMAMPWTRAKKLAAWYRESPERIVELNALFNACFRIAREAELPLIVENVCGAQRWVGRADWHFGSFYLWGDLPALMPITMQRAVMKEGITHRSDDSTNFNGVRVGGLDWSSDEKSKRGCFRDSALKNPGFRFDGSGKSFQSECVKNGNDWFGSGEDCSIQRRESSRSPKRKAASAMIAKIPFPLASHIARCFKPVVAFSSGKESGSGKCQRAAIQTAGQI